MNDFDQLSILLDHKIFFCNKPIMKNDIPDQLRDNQDIKKIATYNNQNKGIIDRSFIIWALENNLSYESIHWFITDFSNIDDPVLNNIVDSFFYRYTIYMDESNNCVKFKFKDKSGATNANWYDDFILAGIIFDPSKHDFDIDSLFNDFHIQNNIIDVKLKHLAKYNGEDNKRFIDILKSEKVNLLLKRLLQNESTYIHWSTQNLLYFSLVDLVDTFFGIPVWLNEAKNILYKFALEDQTLLQILAKYDYPNIKDKDNKCFCSDFIDWIESLTTSDPNEDFILELLRQGAKSVRKSGDMIFLKNNIDSVMIESFVSLYALRLANFPNSIIHFDQWSEVENNIEHLKKIFCTNKTPLYDFLDSKNNKWIQLSDMISGLTGAFMAYLNTHNVKEINNDFSKLNTIQMENLELFIKLREKSVKKNMFFEHKSNNYTQISRINFLQNYFNNQK